MSREITSKIAMDILQVTRGSISNYIKRGELKPIRAEGRTNIFLYDDIVALKEIVEKGKQSAGMSSICNTNKADEFELLEQPSADLNEIGQGFINQLVHDMKELDIYSEFFSIQIMETAINYQLYKQFQKRFLLTMKRDDLNAQKEFYKNFQDGLKSIGMTPQAKKQLKGDDKGQQELSIIGDAFKLMAG